MKNHQLTRRQFLSRTALGAAAAMSNASAMAQHGSTRPAINAQHGPIAALVKKHTGRDATSVEELKWFQVYGDSNSTSHSVRCGEREYVVRVPRKPREWPLGALGLEADYHAVIGKYVCRKLREERLGAPIVYAVDRDCDIIDRPCSVASRVPGRPWRYYEELWRADRTMPPPTHGREMGKFVRGVHDIPARKGFGPVTDDGIGLMESWSDFVWTLFQAWARKAYERSAISEVQLALSSAIIDKWVPQCEIHRGHILWMADIMFGALVDAQKKKVTGVSHAVEAWSGDPDYELEWFAYYAEDTESLIGPPDEFAEGYGRPYNEKSDKRSFYRMSVYLCKFTWLDMRMKRAKHHLQRFDELLKRLA